MFSYGQCDTIKHKYFTVYFNSNNHLPKYVNYKLYKKDQERAKLERKGFSFKKDPDCQLSLIPSDYVKSGFDKGHLMNYNVNDFDSTAAIECFYMTNIAPQYPNMNRGVWQKVERRERELLNLYDSTYCQTGIIIGNNYQGKLNIPEYFYKVVSYFEYVSKEWKTEVYIVPNTKNPPTDIKKVTTIELKKFVPDFTGQ